MIDAFGHVDPASRAPGQLEKVRCFINTLDIEAGADALATPDALAAWLAAHDLLGAATSTASAAELAQAVALREALRSVLVTHARPAGDEPAGDEPAGPAPVAGLRELAAGLPTRLAVSDDGQVRAEPAPVSLADSPGCSLSPVTPRPAARGPDSRCAVPATAAGPFMTGRPPGPAAGAAWPSAVLAPSPAATAVAPSRQPARPDRDRPGGS